MYDMMDEFETWIYPPGTMFAYWFENMMAVSNWYKLNGETHEVSNRYWDRYHYHKREPAPVVTCESILKEVIEFIENNNISDEFADDGGGHTDTWRSGEFDNLIDRAKRILGGG